MKVVFIHGTTATGKLTVANHLLREISGRLLDNHASIDFARTVFDFGAPGFWELVHRTRCSALELAAKNGVPVVIMTFCYVEPDDRPMLDGFVAIATRNGGAFLPVFLRCSREELTHRIGNPDRVERKKLTSTQALAEYLDKHNFARAPQENCLVIDTDRCTANEAARDIVEHFGLIKA